LGFDFNRISPGANPVWIKDASSDFDIEFPSIPRTMDDVAITNPTTFSNIPGFSGSGDWTLAEWWELMWSDISESMIFFMDIENSNGAATCLDNFFATRDVGRHEIRSERNRFKLQAESLSKRAD